MNDTIIPKWKQRVFVVEAIYSNLIYEYEDSYLHIYNFQEWSDFEKKIYKNYLNNKNKYMEEIQTFLKKDWSVDRLNVVILAIFLEAISEFYAVGTCDKVLIQQSVITAKKYAEDEYKLINAVLDNYWKSKS